MTYTPTPILMTFRDKHDDKYYAYVKVPIESIKNERLHFQIIQHELPSLYAHAEKHKFSLGGIKGTGLYLESAVDVSKRNPTEYKVLSNGRISRFYSI